MSDLWQPSRDDLPPSARERIDKVCNRFESAWKAARSNNNPRPIIEDYLGNASEPERSALERELVALDIDYRHLEGENPGPDEYLSRFRKLDKAWLVAILKARFDNCHNYQAGAIACPHCNHPLQDGTGQTVSEICPACHRALGLQAGNDLSISAQPAGEVAAEDPPIEPGQLIGRYRVVRLLGEGGFGRVYLAEDEKLKCQRAVKVPHKRLVIDPRGAELYVAEAQIVAALDDHPNIVRVLDIGATEDFPCFIVSKFIDGSSLAEQIIDRRPDTTASAELVATVAEALHYAHGRGVFHRDIKPGNILLDTTGKPYLSDFGLALKEEDVGKGPTFCGTLLYMSPEQARGEGNRVDGRSDIFSLGVVFYELMTKRRPFRGDTKHELIDQILNLDPRPPRQINDKIVRELERICLKALSKRAADRYATASDMAADLRHFIDHPPIEPSKPSRPARERIDAPTIDIAAASDRSPPSEQPIQIDFKGLRSFDEHDAGFFLGLLPGPRDRDGVPDSIRFWQVRLAERDPDQTFSVGLIYGPSGCGKSSFVKAGLLPLPGLAENLDRIYVEATGEETEHRLLNRLRRQYPGLPEDLDLKDALAAIRRGQGLSKDRKLLIVLDQFEQWLHAKQRHRNTELVQALRQCDGERVQCIVLVRDDFWLATTRFFADLEIDLVQGRNIALVDLFDPDHAKKVLAAMGRKLGKLPEKPKETSEEQKEFLEQAVSGLAQDGKVICVRLALFAEMMRNHPWVPASLKAVGGAQGVGVNYLEETFASSMANPQHRLHQKAVRAILKTLLPESGTDIKGNMRSQQDLITASRYSDRPKDFAALVRILDQETRLITPTDPEGMDQEDATASELEAGHKYYQLTHDYLVPSIRDWLTRKQKETWRGRAELRLAERAALWNHKREKRYLPSLVEWTQIRALTNSREWNKPQQRMMREATAYHALRASAVFGCLVLCSLIGREWFGRLQAKTLLARALDAPTEYLSSTIESMAPYRRWIDPLLHETLQDAQEKGDERKQLHASLALAPTDPAQAEYIYGRLLKADPHEVAVMVDLLEDHKQELNEDLWRVLQGPKNDANQRLRAACALAKYDSRNLQWNDVGADVASKLVTENNPAAIGKWLHALRPVRIFLMAPLANILEDERYTESERSAATLIYADYASDTREAIGDLERRLGKTDLADLNLEGKNVAAKRQANIAVALLQMGQYQSVRCLLQQSQDPTARTYLIHRLPPSRVDPSTLVRELEREKDASIRRALILTLGEMELNRLPPGQRQEWIAEFLQLYRSDPDPGIHGALEWLLGRWNQRERLTDIDKELMTGKVEGTNRWYLSRRHGHRMMIVAQPLDFWMGDGEQRCRVRIKRDYAIAANEVTVKQFLEFRPGHQLDRKYSPTGDCPVNNVTWYEAAAYCNWLSEQEGLSEDQWCYQRNDKGMPSDGVRLVPDCLHRAGYRLPTDAEWEYACRAGSETKFSYGNQEELAVEYAWHFPNSNARTHPVRELKPNDLGLFDVHGNALEWCEGTFQQRKQGEEEKAMEEVIDVVTKKDHRVLRGGSFYSSTVQLRSADRNWVVPSLRLNYGGFRVARTVR